MRAGSYNETRTGAAMGIDASRPLLLVPVVSPGRCFHRSIAALHRRDHSAAGKSDASLGRLCQTWSSSLTVRGRAFFPAAMVAATRSLLPSDLPVAVT